MLMYLLARALPLFLAPVCIHTNQAFHGPGMAMGQARQMTRCQIGYRPKVSCRTYSYAPRRCLFSIHLIVIF
ncbi:hypothetical protein GGR52DRAFT_1954 [Hypoxylon sp. FL1284]|nr:hypothetical protein GGR52DRAFT_1954 [Hypoxylon sp. FL1284]